MLKVDNISAAYNKKIIIEKISFSLHPSGLLGLLGLNGVGKTTLLKVIGGLLKPTEGRVIIGDKDILEYKNRERAKYISYMPQRNSIIYNTLVIDVVLMGITPYLNIFSYPTEADREKAYEALKIVNMEKYYNSNFLHLSEGEKQLVIIARSLLQNSQIMLYDEPDSSLDFNNKHLVLSKIREIILNHNKTGIISLHDPNMALEYCDHILMLKDGKLHSYFTTKEIDKAYISNLFSELYGKVEAIEYKNRYYILKS